MGCMTDLPKLAGSDTGLDASFNGRADGVLAYEDDDRPAIQDEARGAYDGVEPTFMQTDFLH
jgi:hypothetical protein